MTVVHAHTTNGANMAKRTLYHITPRTNCWSITNSGLLVSCAQTATQAIWLASRNRLDWLLVHMRRRWGLHNDGLATYQATVPSTWIFKASKGLYLCYHDIPTSRLTMLTT